MNFSRVAAYFIAISLISTFPAYSQTGPSVESKDTSATQSVEVPDGVNSEGSFRHRVAFDIPEFRGLVPKIGLAYSSSNKGLGSEQAITGVGWRLSGFSSLERVSVGRGSPSFDDQRDVFVLDGSELLACADGDATNPYPTARAYPDRYKTDVASASCLAGGNLSTLVESFRRIELKTESYGGQNIDYFEVTNTKGTTYTYRSIGVLAGDSAAVGVEDFNILFRRKYLLSEIKDTQTTPNVVTIEYDIEAIERGRVHRPRAVNYGGYSVEFGYQTFADPLASFAIGSLTRIGEVFSRLDSVLVRDGTQEIRAYKLQYDRSPVTQAHRLISIEQYGGDVQVTNGLVSGGSQLPDLLHGLVYQDDDVELTPQTFPGSKFHDDLKIVDLDLDNSDDIVFMSHRLGQLTTIPGGSNDEPDTQVCSDLGLTPKQASFSVDVNGNRTIAYGEADPVWSAYGGYTYVDPANTAVGSTLQEMSVFIPYAGEYDSHHASMNRGYQTRHLTANSSGENQEIYYVWHPDGSIIQDIGLQSGTQTVLQDQFGNFGEEFVVGNFDDDPAFEVQKLAVNEFYDFDGAGFTLMKNLSFSPNPSGRDVTLTDIDGDGTDEELIRNGFGYSGQPTSLGWLLAEHWKDTVFQHIISNSPLEIADTYFATGDFNGDGMQDIVSANNQNWSRSGGRAIRVQRSTGKGYGPLEVWLTETASPSLWAAYENGFGTNPSQLRVVDINNDGLDDVIVLGRPVTSYCLSNGGFPSSGINLGSPNPFSRLNNNAWVFLSNGHSFVLDADYPTPFIDNYVGHGDFDGNGLPDFVSADPTDGKILFGDGPVANLLVEFTDQLGGVTKIDYAPSTSFAGNTVNGNVPAVSQVVASLIQENGLGQSRITSFAYANSQYDYQNRQSLGFGSITVTLPQVAPAAAPKLVTVYANDNIASAGKVKSQTYFEGNDTYRMVLNEWTSSVGVTGPFRVDLFQERSRVKYGAELIETRKRYAFDEFGQTKTVFNYGFSGTHKNPVSWDFDTGDNYVVAHTYARNLTKYIVDLPKRKHVQAGVTYDNNRADWQVFEEYIYDNAGSIHTPPEQGNVTNVRVWDGNLSSEQTVRETIREADYDTHGNVVAARDAKGYQTDFEYDTSKHLFLTKTTTPDGYSVLTSWNTGCQAPATTTDANGQVTTLSRDIHCRESRTDLPNGGFVEKAYKSFGDPSNQYVETNQSSAFTGDPNVLYSDEVLINTSREYINGFGETYRTATAGNSSAENDLISTRSYFDERGRLAWQSVPLAFSQTDNTATIASNQKTLFISDSLGRQVEVLQPNGAKTTEEYAVKYLSVSPSEIAAYPAITHKDAHCYDGVTETICGEAKSVMDYRGNVIHTEQYDLTGTDTNGSNSGRVTKYAFDPMNRLTGVTDQSGAVWNYTYDFQGNRISADDPALGVWSMEYDPNNNLTRQVDAKGQVIQFTHDMMNRITRKSVNWTDDIGAAQSDVIDYTYNGANFNALPGHNLGKLTLVEGAHNAIRYSYDEMGNVTAEQHSVDIQGGAGAFSFQADYDFTNDFDSSGALSQSTIPTNSSGGIKVFDDYRYDTGGRLTGFGNWVLSTSYDLRSNPTAKAFGNGMTETRLYDPAQGWINSITVADSSGTTVNRVSYWRTIGGRVSEQFTGLLRDRYSFCYDYAGRLLVAADLTTANKTCGTLAGWQGSDPRDQFFSYRVDGSMASNSHVGAYSYTGSPVSHAPASVAGQTFTYDGNGNMTLGLHGKVMRYDGENRPLSVTHSGNTSEYLYGADGTRLMKKETLAQQAEKVTLYVGGIEVRDPGTSETVLAYPHENVRLTFANVNGAPQKTASYLFRDQLNSVRMLADQNEVAEEKSSYKPFGEENESILTVNAVPETIGWIGERFDAGAGLQFLNARYYDTELAMFIQPDWFEVTEPGVGTNRYSYSFNDPVNLSDPEGNEVEWFEPDYRFDAQTGTDSHRVLADWVDVETSYQAEKPIFSGFDPIFPRLESTFRGRPDASRRIDSKTAEFFDWKPVTHNTKPNLHAKDMAQQARWVVSASSEEKSMIPADTRRIVTNGAVVGMVMGPTETNLGHTIRREYEVVTYSSDRPGIAYYDLRETGAYRSTLSEQIRQEFRNVLRNQSGNAMSTPLALPLPGPGPILIPIP